MGKTAGADVERRRRAIARSQLMGGIKGVAQDELVRRASMLTFPRRSMVYREGQDGEAIFVIAAGRARLFRGGTGGIGDRDVTLDYRTVGDLLGETVLASMGVYAESVEAVEGLEAVRLPIGTVVRVLETEPSVAGRLMRYMADKRVEAEGRMEGLLTRPVESRVAEFLLRAATRYGVPDPRGTLIGVKFTHQEIAAWVGSTRETVTLVLGSMKRADEIAFDHRRVLVRDSKKLEGRV
jgi:CRP-like cAMP-binding protein